MTDHNVGIHGFEVEHGYVFMNPWLGFENNRPCVGEVWTFNSFRNKLAYFVGISNQEPFDSKTYRGSAYIIQR